MDSDATHLQQLLTALVAVAGLLSGVGSALGAFLGQWRNRRVVEAAVERLFDERLSEVRNRVDALEIKAWGNSRRWHYPVREDLPNGGK